MERQRNRADRADILRDVVAALAVAARRRQDELAAFVAKIDRDAVDLRIGDVAAGDRETRCVGLVDCRVVLLAQFATPCFGLRAALASRFQLGVDGEQASASVASYARDAHLRRSAASYVLSIENIGRACATVRKPSIGSPPTRCVGLSGVMSSGCAASSSFSCARSLSYS